MCRGLQNLRDGYGRKHHELSGSLDSALQSPFMEKGDLSVENEILTEHIHEPHDVVVLKVDPTTALLSAVLPGELRIHYRRINIPVLTSKSDWHRHQSAIKPH